MLGVDVITEPDLQPAAAHDAHTALVAAVRAGRRQAVLSVSQLDGEIVSLGRYHMAPPLTADTRRLHRRAGGGQVIPLGNGFVSIALILPHRSALVSADPRALRPEQALNRCVRGLLAALRGLGVDAVYPGRDRITIDRRLFGVVSLQAEADGITMFEASLAITGDWTVLPAWITAVDRDGLITAQEYSPDQVTWLARHSSRTPTLNELAHLVASAYAQEFGVQPTAAGCESAAPDVSRHLRWLSERCPRASLDRHSLAWGQLGVFEAHVGLDPTGGITDVMLTGDFIADAPSLERLEERLRGCPPRVETIDPIVRSVYRDPDSFLLGLGSLDLVAQTIARAA